MADGRIELIDQTIEQWERIKEDPSECEEFASFVSQFGDTDGVSRGIFQEHAESMLKTLAFMRQAMDAIVAADAKQGN